MKGGSLKTNELKQFLEASYLDPAPNEINGYTLDTALSNLYGKVYVNTNLKKVVVSFRGTKEATDFSKCGLCRQFVSVYINRPL